MDGVWKGCERLDLPGANSLTEAPAHFPNGTHLCIVLLVFNKPRVQGPKGSAELIYLAAPRLGIGRRCLIPVAHRCQLSLKM